MLRSFRCLLALSLLGTTASAQLLYFTGFESREFVVGQSIDGVDGWTSLLAPDAPQIVDGRATSSGLGRRALRCWGGSPELEPIQGLLDGAWAREVTLPAWYRHRAVVHVQADVRLDGPDTGNGPANDLLSANLYARNGVGASAFMYLSSTGEVYCFANSVQGSVGYAFPTQVALGEYNRLGITLDYTTHIATFHVNCREVGSLPFGGTANEGFAGALLEFAAYDDPLVVDPSQYTGYWDNVLVFALPRWW